MSEEAQILLQYEENQVLWAKIRGFPWWPAYVNQVHSHKDPQKVQYTVIFFGDNTHSRLGPSKLRKFLQLYTSFYTKSKTNRKLKISIMKAQQRLKENQQNVQIYEQLRGSIKNKRKTGTKTQSRGSSSENQQENQPQLKKSRTVEHRGRKQKKYFQNKSSKSQNSQQQNESQEQQSSNKQQKVVKTRKQGRKQPQRINNLLRSSGLSEENEVNSPVKRQVRLRTRRSAQPIVQSLANKQSQKNEDIQSEKSKSADKVSEQKKPLPKGRKGRPRKNEMKSKQQKKQEQPDSEPFQSEDQASEKQKTFAKKKFPQKPLLKKVQSQNIQPNLSSHQIKNIEKIKKSIPNKSQLIRTLSSISITPNNIKEILDLGVSNALLDGGQMTKEVYVLLETMKATLLHKFFPDDLKMKKKHERMTKKKKNILKTKIDEDDRSEQKNENEDEQIGEEKQQMQEELLEELEAIRKKTVLKIQRILKKSGIEENAKNLAMKLQASFQEKSQNSGEKYANIAYNHMRKLKNKVQEKEPSQRIVDYLNQITESMDNSCQR